MEEQMTTRDEVKEENGMPADATRSVESGDDAQAKAAEHLRDLQRLAAEFSNYRKRADAEKTDVIKYANADLIRRLLTVLDSFDRALEQLPPELQRFSWVEGIWLVERQLRAILEQEGLVPIAAAGRQFDPFEMEAVMYDESVNVPEGTVISELQKGYKLHDRVIRPALVKVAKAPQAVVKEKE
jgi:molecular chaperone GrpE